MSFQHVTCFVHGIAFPKSTCHLHHSAPRAAGGGDEQANLIWLCANCHNTAHRVAQLQEQGKSGEASDTSMTLYPTPASRQRFQRVVKEILEAETLAKGTGKGKSHTMVELHLTPEVHTRLKTLVADIRVNGKRTGVAKYVESLVIQHLRQKGYL